MGKIVLGDLVLINNGEVGIVESINEVKGIYNIKQLDVKRFKWNPSVRLCTVDELMFLSPTDVRTRLIDLITFYEANMSHTAALDNFSDACHRRTEENRDKDHNNDVNAKRMYFAYAMFFSEENNDDNYPTWEKIGPVIQRAWRNIAIAVNAQSTAMTKGKAAYEEYYKYIVIVPDGIMYSRCWFTLATTTRLLWIRIAEEAV